MTAGKARSSAKIAVHRTRVLDAQDITTVRGIPVTTVARTLVDLASVLSADRLAGAIKEAERRNAFDLKAIEAVMVRTRGRRGRGHEALNAALAERRAFEQNHTRSPLEDAFLRLLRDRGLPLPATNAHVEGYEVDAVWRTQRIAVELDGWRDHGTRRAFEEDRERDATLAAVGWRVVRFTRHQLTQGPDRVTQTLRRLGIR